MVKINGRVSVVVIVWEDRSCVNLGIFLKFDLDMKCNCMMGLFPEIHRAWLTIDSDIYVWLYDDG